MKPATRRFRLSVFRILHALRNRFPIDRSAETVTDPVRPAIAFFRLPFPFALTYDHVDLFRFFEAQYQDNAAKSGESWPCTPTSDAFERRPVMLQSAAAFANQATLDFQAMLSKSLPAAMQQFVGHALVSATVPLADVARAARATSEPVYLDAIPRRSPVEALAHPSMTKTRAEFLALGKRVVGTMYPKRGGAPETVDYAALCAEVDLERKAAKVRRERAPKERALETVAARKDPARSGHLESAHEKQRPLRPSLTSTLGFHTHAHAHMQKVQGGGECLFAAKF